MYLEKGEFEGYDGATKLENNNLQEADDTLGFLPTVTAKEGYTWTGWEVTNKAGEVVYTLDTNTSSIVFPKGVEDDYTVTATFTENKTTAVVNANVVVDPERVSLKDMTEQQSLRIITFRKLMIHLDSFQL